ncbi:hypothetical protein D3C86_1488090 [compost metagenome]
MNKADIESYELDSKVAAAEDQEEKEKAEADEANKKLLVYVAIGVSGLILVYIIGDQWQKHTNKIHRKK